MPTQQEYDLLPTTSTHHEDDLKDEGALNDNNDLQKNEETLFITEETPYMERLKILFEHASPVSFSFVISIATTFITQYYAGHFELDGNQTIVFAGVALSVMFFNVSCRSLLIGLTSAVDTLASQHNGAQNYREVGIVLQRCFAILSVFCIPMIPVWVMSDSLFALLGIDSKVCRVIGVFTRIRLVALPADIVNESYEKYLMAIGEMSIPLYANIIIGIVILVLNELFMNYFHWSWEALSWAVVISEYIGMSAMVGLSLPCASVKRTLQPFSWDSFKEWKEFIWLALPGVGMLCSEWWAFEFLTIFASLVSTEAVAAQAVIMQMSTLAFMFPMGIAVTGTSFIGNTLGAAKKQLAMDITKLGFTATLMVEVLVSSSILLFGPAFVRMFALDEEVRTIAYEVVPYLAIFTVSDSIQCFSSGVMRAAGRQNIGAIVNIGTYYSVGLPLAWYLCFHTALGVKGLMAGISAAVIIQTIVLLTIIFRFADQLYTVDKSVLEAAQRKLDSANKSSSGSGRDGSRAASVEYSQLGGSAGGSGEGGEDDIDSEFVDIEMSPIQPLKENDSVSGNALKDNNSSNGHSGKPSAISVIKMSHSVPAASSFNGSVEPAASAGVRNPLRPVDQ